MLPISSRAAGDYAIATVELENLPETLTINDVIRQKMVLQKSQGVDDPFYVVDLNDLVRKHLKWQALLPRAIPFFAVKSLSEPPVVELLTKLGCGYDCASKDEIALVLASGVEPSKVVYAHTCKQPDMLRYAAQQGVDLLTFDNEDELRKLKDVFPTARLLIRILPPKVKRTYSEPPHKFGCAPEAARGLLRFAKELGLNVVGVSFHVGFGCQEATAFALAVQAAAKTFVEGQEEGHEFNVLDIGGGFPGYPDSGITFEQIAAVLGPALDEHFPPESGVQIIAEPGTYYSASAMHLAVQVIGRRFTYRQAAAAADGDGSSSSSEVRVIEYYVNDGCYGSFNVGNEGRRKPVPLNFSRDVDGGQSQRHLSVLFGPTCDRTDVILRDFEMPEAQLGDWLVFPYMGHYTYSAAGPFNSMPRPRLYYVRMGRFDSEFVM